MIIDFPALTAESKPRHPTCDPSFSAGEKAHLGLAAFHLGFVLLFLDQCEIQVDRGTGYQVLTFDTTPGYTDTQAFPATLTTWKYRGIYRVGDAQVGIWSAEVSVTVGG